VKSQVYALVEFSYLIFSRSEETASCCILICLFPGVAMDQPCLRMDQRCSRMRTHLNGAAWLRMLVSVEKRRR
jgi:hypothetical protein